MIPHIVIFYSHTGRTVEFTFDDIQLLFMRSALDAWSTNFDPHHQGRKQDLDCWVSEEVGRFASRPRIEQDRRDRSGILNISYNSQVQGADA